MAADLNNSYLTEKAQDYAKLSLLAYADWKLSDGAWVLDAYKKDGGLRIGYQEYVDIWDELEAKGYSISSFHPNDASGFSATIFQKDGAQILAIRGTETFVLPSDPGDVQANILLVANRMPYEQFESMVKFIKDNNLDQTRFDVTGHSLGGFLAQAAKTTFAGNAGDVYSYNSPGAKDLQNCTMLMTDPRDGKAVMLMPGISANPLTVDIDFLISVGDAFKWEQTTWTAYQSFVANRYLPVAENKVYNVSGKDLASPTAGLHTDIGSEVFIAGSNHGIEKVINDFTKNLYYLDPRKPVSFIGSKADEMVNGNYNSKHYEDSPIQNLSIEGGYGDDTIYGSTGNDTLYGDLESAITGESALKTTGNYGGEAGDDWLIGGKGNDTLIGGGGDDTYKITYGDGNDTITDSEGHNTIIYTDKSGKDRKVYTFFQNGANTWTTADGKLTLVNNTIILEDGNSILFSDTQPTDFGITLLDTPSDPTTTTTILGDLDPLHLNDTLYDSAGNDRVDSHGLRPGSSYRLMSSVGIQRASASRRGAPTALLVEGATRAPLIEGRSGNDMIYGWQGGIFWQGETTKPAWSI